MEYQAPQEQLIRLGIKENRGETVKKPNVIMINSDHQALHQWTFMKTSRIGRFIEQFVEKERNLHTPAVRRLCVGRREERLLTGLYPHAHKQYHNETNPPYSDEVYLDSLAEAGYRNYYLANGMQGRGVRWTITAKDCLRRSMGNPYVTKEYKDYLKKRNLPAAAHRIERVFFWADKSQQAYQKGSPDEVPRNGELFKLQDPRHCCEAAYGIYGDSQGNIGIFFLSELACENWKN